MKLSFIIPLFNGAEYIEKCLNSILNQHLTLPYEIIVVNDGSKDNGPARVAALALKQDCIHLINQENQGVGAARNRGLAEASGDYIFFVDADDALIQGATSLILKKAFSKNQNPDIIVFDRHFVLPKSEQENLPPLTTNIIYSGNVKEFILSHGIKAFVTSFIFKREILKGISFNNFRVGEDLMYMLEVFNKVDSTITAFDSKLYIYNVNTTSAVHRSGRQAIRNLVDNYIQIHSAISKGALLKDYSSAERKRLTTYDVNYFCFAKIMSAPFSLRETKQIAQQCKAANMFDFEGFNSRFYNVIRCIARHPLLMWGLSPIYRHIYIPFFKKG